MAITYRTEEIEITSATHQMRKLGLKRGIVLKARRRFINGRPSMMLRYRYKRNGASTLFVIYDCIHDPDAMIRVATCKKVEPQNTPAC